MLQPLTIQRRATGGTAQQETLAHHIAAAPDHVANTLHTEHGVEDIKRDHGQTVHRVGAACGHEGCHCPDFTNAFL